MVRISGPKQRCLRTLHAHLNSVEWRGGSSIDDAGCAADAPSTLRDRTLTVSRSRKSVRNGLREGLSLLAASEGDPGADTSGVSSSSRARVEGVSYAFDFEYAVTLGDCAESAERGAAGVWAGLAWIGDAATNRGLDSGDRRSRVFDQSA